MQANVCGKIKQKFLPGFLLYLFNACQYRSYNFLFKKFLSTSSLFKTSFYFSEWRHHHSGSQTSNLEFILDTLFSLTLAPTHPPSIHYQVLSFYLINISQICLLSISHHLSNLSHHQHLWPAFLELPPNWSSCSYCGVLGFILCTQAEFSWF